VVGSTRSGASDDLYCVQGAALNDELDELRNGGCKPVLVGPQPFSLEEILRNVSPVPDQETERFVAVIYADRR